MYLIFKSSKVTRLVEVIAPNLLHRMVRKNIDRTQNPFGVEKSTLNTWWKGIEPDADGEWMFFTGFMYQLSPLIYSALRYLERVERSNLAQKAVFSEFVMNLSGFIMARGYSESLKRETDSILSAIYRHLVSSGAEPYYLPELDTYSGVMLHDLGDDGGFERHIISIAESFEENGIDKIVTCDPHTTYVMSELLPEITGKKVTVKSYLDMVKAGNEEGIEDMEIGVHDPCYYARHLGLEGKIARLLRKSGMGAFIPENSGKMTSCCGGPAEYISPIIAREMAKMRLEEFNGRIVCTACPVCLISFRRAGGKAVDVATTLRVIE